MPEDSASSANVDMEVAGPGSAATPMISPRAAPLPVNATDLTPEMTFIHTERDRLRTSRFRGPVRFQNERDSRLDLAARVEQGTSRLDLTPDEVAQAQWLMDEVCLLLHAFFSLVQPFALSRCAVHPRSFQHVRTIRERHRFIQTNCRMALDIYKWSAQISPGDEFPTVISLSAVLALVEELLWIPCRGKQGRWQWDGFWLNNEEWTDLTDRILQTYIAGFHPLRSPRLPADADE